MKNLLRSTTSLGLSLALAFPHGAFAQEQNLAECGPVGEATEFPCAFDDQTVENAEELRVIAGLSADAEASAEVEAEAEAEVETEAEAEPGSILDQAADAVESTGDAAAAAVDSAVEQADEAADAAEAQAEAAAEAASEAEAEATAEAEVDEEVEAEAETEAEVEQEVEAEPVVEQEAEVEAETMQDAEVEAETTAEAEATADTAAETTEPVETTESELEAETATEAEAVQNDEATATTAQDAETEAEMSGEAVGEEDNAGLTEEQIQAREERREARRAERREERREERRAEREAAAAAAAAAAENDAEAEVVTEEVTEEDVRTSDEDFDTKVTAAGEAEAAASNDDDSGLSDFEKALLLGLGAVAVGSVLNNGEKIVSRSGDRVVVQDDTGELRVLKDDNALLRRPGDEVQTQTFDDGSTRTIVTKSDGSRVETIRSRDGTVLRRTNFDAQGREYVLVDDLVEEREVVVNDLPQVQETQQAQRASTQDEAALRQALQTELRNDQGRTFSLRQVREIREVRSLAPQLELDAVRFPTGSAAIQPEQARSLANIGTTLRDLIQKDPRTVILVEGHTDAVGDASYNLALSDRRAETVALALTEYFDVPPANLITQGYGESQLRVPTTSAEPANRRAVVRNITGLLR